MILLIVVMIFAAGIAGGLFNDLIERQIKLQKTRQKWKPRK